MTFNSLSLNDLADHCAEETSKFHRNQQNDTRYCYELMRRAFKENVSDALTHVYRIYEPLVRNWVYSHSHFADTGEHAEDFVNVAMTTFYFAVRSKNFEDFGELSRLLSYLKMCVHTSILQALRKRQHIQIEPHEADDESAHTPDDSEKVDRALDKEQLWEYIRQLFPDEHDMLLIRCYFVYDLKPAEITELHPAIWKKSRDVTVNLQRIRRVLRADKQLREFLGDEFEDD